MRALPWASALSRPFRGYAEGEMGRMGVWMIGWVDEVWGGSVWVCEYGSTGPEEWKSGRVEEREDGGREERESGSGKGGAAPAPLFFRSVTLTLLHPSTLLLPYSPTLTLLHSSTPILLPRVH